jgi:DNA polymerase/3'-5' exonuclease PolX
MVKKEKDIIETEVVNSANQKIVKEFEQLIEQIKIQIDNAPTTKDYISNSFRLKQISNSLEIIKKFPKEIKNGNDLKDIKGIGKGTIKRIDEILSTGKLEEVKIKKKEKKYAEYIEELQKIFGIGHTKAYELVTKYNIKTIDALKKAYNDGTVDLPDQIVMGLKYHDIYKQNIPRQEIDKINQYLNGKAKEVNNQLNITICGSYRRGKKISNDIDVLIAHPNVKTKLQLMSKDNYLIKFINLLKNDKFILDDLTDKEPEKKYMGYCKYNNNPVRRIDIRYIPYDSYHAALLYFTGSGNFNKKMRGVATSMGYLLNEYGLFKLQNGKKKLIKTSSEKEIFEALGMEYLPPEKRN